MAPSKNISVALLCAACTLGSFDVALGSTVGIQSRSLAEEFGRSDKVKIDEDRLNEFLNALLGSPEHFSSSSSLDLTSTLSTATSIGTTFTSSESESFESISKSKDKSKDLFENVDPEALLEMEKFKKEAFVAAMAILGGKAKVELAKFSTAALAKFALLAGVPILAKAGKKAAIASVPLIAKAKVVGAKGKVIGKAAVAKKAVGAKATVVKGTALGKVAAVKGKAVAKKAVVKGTKVAKKVAPVAVKAGAVVKKKGVVASTKKAAATAKAAAIKAAGAKLKTALEAAARYPEGSPEYLHAVKIAELEYDECLSKYEIA